DDPNPSRWVCIYVLRPGKLPDDFRRDLPPHRAELLRLLAKISVVCGLLSFALLAPAVLGLSCGVAALVLAKRDLRRMQAGLMDPRGRNGTLAARDRAIVGIVLCLIASWVWLYLVCRVRPIRGALGL